MRSRSEVIFTNVPEWVALEPELSPGARTLYSVLASYYKQGLPYDGVLVWPSQVTMAKHMNRSDRQVRNYLEELGNFGAITTEAPAQHSNSNNYRLWWTRPAPIVMRYLHPYLLHHYRNEASLNGSRFLWGEEQVSGRTRKPGSREEYRPKNRYWKQDLDLRAYALRAMGADVEWLYMSALALADSVGELCAESGFRVVTQALHYLEVGLAEYDHMGAAYVTYDDEGEPIDPEVIPPHRLINLAIDEVQRAASTQQITSAAFFGTKLLWLAIRKGGFHPIPESDFLYAVLDTDVTEAWGTLWDPRVPEISTNSTGPTQDDGLGDDEFF